MPETNAALPQNSTSKQAKPTQSAPAQARLDLIDAIDLLASVSTSIAAVQAAMAAFAADQNGTELSNRAAAGYAKILLEAESEAEQAYELLLKVEAGE